MSLLLLFGSASSASFPSQSLRINALLIDPDTLYPPFVGLGEPPQYLPPTVSMRSGFRTSPDDLVREWTGYWVSRADLDQRNPQDFVRGRREQVKAYNAEPADVFLNENDSTRDDF